MKNANVPPLWAQEMFCEMRSIRELLERQQSGRGARDAADRLALETIGRTIGADEFSMTELLLTAAADTHLSEALLAADIDASDPSGRKAAGKWLARLEGSRLADGRVLVRAHRDRLGVRWQFAHLCVSNTQMRAAAE
jgi:hypothetical protein